MVPIVFSTDHNFIVPTGVAITSLLKSSNSTHYDIYVIINSSVLEEDKDLLSKQVKKTDADSKLSFIDIGDAFKDGHETRGITIATYYRLLIPWLLPHLDKVIYSDGDIIFKGSLEQLYNIDLGDNYFAGNNIKSNDRTTNNRIKKNKLIPEEYICAGFIVINCKLQRQDNLKEIYMRLSKNKYYYQDQDIINIVSEKKKLLISSIYNCTPSTFKRLCGGLELEYNDIVVIHYAGSKPWKEFCPFWMEWWEAYRESIFFNPSFYYKITAQCLNPSKYIKLLFRKFIIKYIKV